MAQTEFKIRSYGRTELAQVYFPCMHPSAAWEKLKGWLLINPALRHLPTQRQRTFTPAEVRLIIGILGEP